MYPNFGDSFCIVWLYVLVQALQEIYNSIIAAQMMGCCFILKLIVAGRVHV